MRVRTPPMRRGADPTRTPRHLDFRASHRVAVGIASEYSEAVIGVRLPREAWKISGLNDLTARYHSSRGNGRRDPPGAEGHPGHRPAAARDRGPLQGDGGLVAGDALDVRSGFELLFLQQAVARLHRPRPG